MATIMEIAMDYANRNEITARTWTVSLANGVEKTGALEHVAGQVYKLFTSGQGVAQDSHIFFDTTAVVTARPNQ